MFELDIADVSRQSGLPASTLRFYEEKGLIRPVGRKGQKRQYASDILERLALIALGRVAGFTLEDIASMLGVDGKPRIDRQRLLDKADELDRQIRELTAMREGLRHAAACTAPSHMECPKFQRIVRAAAKGALGERKKAVPAKPL